MFSTCNFILLLLIICLIILCISFAVLWNKRSEKFLKNKPTALTNSIATDNMRASVLNQHHNFNIPVYYLNLDRSPNRKIYMENQFKRYGINHFKRIRAIDGAGIKKPIKTFKKDHTSTIDGVEFWNNYTNLKPTELACTLSHLNAIRTALNDGLEQVLIVEDDCSFALLPYWEKTLDDYIEEFPNDWSCVSLFNMACYIDKNLPDYIDMKHTACNGAVAYIINRKGMKSVMETMDNDILIMDKHHPKNNNTVSKLTSLADVFIYNRIKNCYQRKIPIFFPYNEVGTQDSTIHTDHTWRHNLFANEIIKIYVPSLSLIDLK